MTIIREDFKTKKKRIELFFGNCFHLLFNLNTYAYLYKNYETITFLNRFPFLQFLVL